LILIALRRKLHWQYPEMIMKSSLLLGALASCALAVPTAHEYQLHERRDFIPKAWVEGKELDPKVSLPVRIGLTQSNLDYGHDLLMDLYELAQLFCLRIWN
jgi:hypothetical protein